jgi:predicted DCC family thiol-disulfide oxidoreductase YuxK
MADKKFVQKITKFSPPVVYWIHKVVDDEVVMTTAIFDGNCVICNQTRRLVYVLDWFHRIEFLDLHEHDTVRERFPWLDHEKAMGEVHVVTQDERIFAGYFATRRMMRELPLGIPFWALLQLPGMDWVGQRVYRWIARNRYAVNRFFGVELASCEDGACKLPS